MADDNTTSRRNAQFVVEMHSSLSGPVAEILAELERAGLIRRTGERHNGRPVFVRTAMSAEDAELVLEMLEAGSKH